MKFKRRKKEEKETKEKKGKKEKKENIREQITESEQKLFFNQKIDFFFTTTTMFA